MKKRIVSLLLAVLLLCPSYTAFAAAQEENAASPYYIRVTSIEADLSMPDTNVGRVRCYGRVTAKSMSDYIILYIDLQQLVGSSWRTISSWSASGNKTVILDVPDYVTNGYNYRIKVTAHIYDENNNLIESAYKYDSYNYM